MEFVISFLFLFGLITCINGKPVIYEASDLREIVALLEELSNQQGKYDIAFSHHVDGPKSHHEDTAHISLYDDKYYEGSQRGSSPEKYVDIEINPGLVNTEILNQLFKYKPKTSVRSNENILIIDQQQSEQKSTNNCSPFATCKDRIWSLLRNDENEYDNTEEVLEFLNELEKNFGDNGNSESELRCSGRGCSRDRSDKEESRFENNDRNQNRYNLRCKGNSCSRNRDDKDDNEDENDRDVLLCNGHPCYRNRGNDDRDDRYDTNGSNGNNRCVGDRCGRSRYDRDELSCVGDRCGRNRDDGDRNVRDNLRCTEDRCGRSRDEGDNLRCQEKSCARGGYYEDEDTIYELKPQPSQHKIRNDLDADVLDMADLERLLSNLKGRKIEPGSSKLIENVNLENVLSYSNANDKKSNVQAVVYDLEKRNDRDSLSKLIKSLLTQVSSK